MMSCSQDRRVVVAAAIAASLLMLAFGLTYRVLEAQMLTPTSNSPLDPDALEGFPMQIGGWTGQDVPINDAIVRRTGTDAHISRRYSRGKGWDSVSLYVACGAKARVLMPHRPEICYVRAGWTLVDRHSMELLPDDRMELPCSVFEFTQGGLNTRKLILLNYFVVDGQYCGDVSLLRSKAWRGSGTIDYVVQVQIVASSETATADSAIRLVCAFAVDSASSVARLFDGLEEDRILGEVRGQAKEK